jgi:hypothetical protein
METLQILVLVNISIYKINLRVTVRAVQSEFACLIFRNLLSPGDGIKLLVSSNPLLRFWHVLAGMWPMSVTPGCGQCQ